MLTRYDVPFRRIEDEALRNRFSLGATIFMLTASTSLTFAADVMSRDAEFNIPAQAVESALHEFSRQANVQIMVGTTAVTGQHTDGVIGRLSVASALDQLLQSTDLTYEATGGGNTVTVTRVVTATETSEYAPTDAAPKEDKTTGEDSGRQSRRGSLEEVVVTAQKREEHLQDVPMSITALSGNAMAAAGITNAQDLSFSVSSLTVTETGPGRQMISIRGITGLRGSSSLTGVYLDDMPVSGVQDGFIPAYADVRTIDLDRVEVLKGPQGTLFGEGATGGVIRFITNDPDLTKLGGELGTRIYNTADGGWSEEVTGVLNLPLARTFGLRIAATYEDKSGWIDQPSIGREDINNSEVKHVRSKALWRPSDVLEIKGLVEVHRNKGGGSNIVNQEPVSESNFLQAVDRWAPTDYVDDYDFFNLAVTYDLGFAELLSSTSYVNLDNENTFTQLLDGEPAPWLEVLNRDFRHDGTVASQEFRLTSASTGMLKWTLGAAYKDSELTRTIGSAGTDAILFGGQSRLSQFLANTRPTNESESWAAFGDASVQLTKRFMIGGGLRYFYDSRELFEAATPSLGHSSDNFDKVTFRTYFKVAAAEDVNLYLSAASGFRSGGFNDPHTPERGGPLAYNPEESISYEAGAKMSLLDNHLRIDASFFYSEYLDMLTDTVITSAVDGGPLQFTANGEKARLTGIEWAFDWAATDQLTLGFSGNVIDTKILKVDAENQTPNYAVGDKITGVPDYSLSATVDYGFDWSSSVSGNLRLSFNRQGKSYFTERSNSLILVKEGSAPEKSFLNASVEAEWEGWKWSLFGINLLDEDAILNPTASGWSPQARPRAVGIGINRSF